MRELRTNRDLLLKVNQEAHKYIDSLSQLQINMGDGVTNCRGIEYIDQIMYQFISDLLNSNGQEENEIIKSEQIEKFMNLLKTGTTTTSLSL